ncbi:MAG: helix-turn-helix transcriptional regulator [Lentisphaeria bacterium]|nr:helix-turn-helix transcriptional regulator [Lentisphaeria bacterium]
MKRRYVSLSTGMSRLFGYNYGEYPRHSFLSFSYAGKEGSAYPVQLLSSGYDEWHRECFRQRINSDVFSVEYVQKGTFLFRQNNTTLRANPGEIFLVRLGADSSMQCETETAQKRTVILCGTLLRRILDQIGLDRINLIIPGDRERLDAMFDRIYELSRKETLANYRDACSECYALLLELSAQSTAMHRPPELQRALEYIHENLSEHLTLEKLVHHTGISTATLHRQFQKYLQTSPIGYYLDQKMEKAAGLLRSHIYSVKEIAAEMKYSSPQYFATEFKKKYGITPRQLK